MLKMSVAAAVAVLVSACVAYPVYPAHPAYYHRDVHRAPVLVY